MRRHVHTRFSPFHPASKSEPARAGQECVNRTTRHYCVRNASLNFVPSFELPRLLGSILGHARLSLTTCHREKQRLFCNVVHSQCTVWCELRDYCSLLKRPLWVARPSCVNVSAEQDKRDQSGRVKIMHVEIRSRLRHRVARAPSTYGSPYECLLIINSVDFRTRRRIQCNSERPTVLICSTPA